MNNIYEIKHPLIRHKLTLLRDERTGKKDFKQLAKEISSLLCYEVTKELPLREVQVKTPIQLTKAEMIDGRNMAIVPILRAGLGMVDGFTDLMPTAKVGHVGLYRDPETLKPVEYYSKLPDKINERKVVVLDPMLATGGSAIVTLDLIKEKGAKDLVFVCLLASPEGINALQKAHPNVSIYTACIDEKLNEHAYIIPGLGDAGDRLFGTK